MANLSLSSDSAPDQRTLLTIPPEIRDNIVMEVLLNPARPNFEAVNTPTETTFKNYFSIGFVNKQLYATAKDVVAISKRLVIISMNWDGLTKDIEAAGIPIVTDHHIRTVTFHSMRIHVNFPTLSKKVVKSILVLASDLPDISRVLRALSLDALHPQTHAHGEFPRISMQIQFNEEVTTTKQDQIRLLQSLKYANSIGSIKILKSDDPSLQVIIPGYKGFQYVPGMQLSGYIDDCEKCQWFLAIRKIDGDDYISLSDWKLVLAGRAVAAKNYELAMLRYTEIVTFIGLCQLKNPTVLLPIFDYDTLLDIRSFRAGIGLVENSIWLKKWKDARHHIVHVLQDIDHREWIPKEEKRHAENLLFKVDEYYCRKKVAGSLQRQFRFLGQLDREVEQ